MSTVEEKIKKEIDRLFDKEKYLWSLVADDKDILKFGAEYQDWYSQAIKFVVALAPDRLEEFSGYYLIGPKRKVTTVDNYVIQDYVEGNPPPRNAKNNFPWNYHLAVRTHILNQMNILYSTHTRIDSIQRDVIEHLFAELQDKKLKAAYQLLKKNPRAAGVLAGAVLECHLKCAATNHQIKLPKKAPTIPDLNDLLKEKGVYDLSIYKKIQLLDKLINKCSNQTGSEPTEDEVRQLLIDGVDSIIKKGYLNVRATK